VFLPLTRLCRDACGYCTFAQPPRAGQHCYMTLGEMVDIARAGAELGCTEALFTLGECGRSLPLPRGSAAPCAHDKVATRAWGQMALPKAGDKPELLYPEAAAELRALGHETTLGYVAEAAAAVLRETGLLPHVNAGVMGARDLAALRRASASQGLMLESTSARLLERGQAHHDCPDKVCPRLILA